MRRLPGFLALISVFLFATASCNEDKKKSDEIYVEPTDVAVSGFKLKANTKLLRGLDSVFFSIDLQHAVVYNADSLPKGTKVTDLIPVISYSQYITEATITMTGGEKRSGEINYLKNPNDSVDFTGDVKLSITSSAGNRRTYTLKVNVHKEEPDSLWWGDTSIGTLPSRTGSPVEQRTVMMRDKVVCLVREHDGSYTMSLTEDPSAQEWTRRGVSLGFTPRVRTFTACDNAMYMLDSDGKLYTSADGADWSDTGAVWQNIVGGYGDQVLGLRNSDSGMMLTSWPEVKEYRMPEGFPVDEYTNMYRYQSEWMSQPVGIIAGGVDAHGNVSSRVWGYDGLQWAMLSEDAMPALRGATLIPYFSYLSGKYVWKYNKYSTLMAMGGIDADGGFNRDIYLSYNNGVSWTKGSEFMRMPEFIPGLWCVDNVVVSVPKTSNLDQYWREMPKAGLPVWYRAAGVEIDGDKVTWYCPYIYLFGGMDASGRLYDTVWRGVINRLSFMPII